MSIVSFFIHAQYSNRSNLKDNLPVIDFGDIVVDDPATDFFYLWTYGDWVPEMVYAHYTAHKDKTLLARSRSHFIRLQIDTLYYMLEDKNEKMFDLTKSLLEKALTT